ncbi:carbohydrate sulfotransferase 10 isoform X1 [Paramisgurnus dabryanus]|uniref:carbohydrate sulfotransferase 10 isoform X1 n=1 Tax=Paramisgurnus dabryanus TaxID=90735 RepID=UPI0031F42F5C
MNLPAISNQKKKYGHGNKNAETKTRKIELGWMHYQNCSYKQVRRPNGGGTREIVVKKEDTVSYVLDIGKKLFFPEGESTKGNADDSNFMLCVSGSEEPLKENQTIVSLYEATHYKILRLYVCTRLRDQDCDQSKENDRHLTLKQPQLSSTPDVAPSTSCQYLHTPPSTSMNLNDEDEVVVFLGNDLDTSFDMVSDTLVYSPVHVDHVVTDTFLESVPSESGSVCILEEVMPVTEDPLQPTVSQEPINNYTFFENPRNVTESETIVVRRVHCVHDMIQAFSDKNILNANITFKRVLENGEEEAGIGDGVFQDCLTEFWETFFATRTCGTTYKIPTLHHTYQDREWEAVARIFAIGWLRFGYLPIQLAPPFLKEALSLPSSETSLMEVFFNYISPTEKDVLSEALQDFQSADMDEVLSVLSSHNCSVLPNQNNLQKIIEEIAHKEMMQQPAYIIKCWQPILQSIGETMTAEKLDQITENLQPKARSVAKSIKFPPTMSPSETAVSHHLLRFVRERDQRELGLFLRYCTGSDLFLSKTIQVTFKEMNEFSRRPIAHTCTQQLELACDYSTYAEFRSEFSSVLNTGVWIMDMI